MIRTITRLALGICFLLAFLPCSAQLGGKLTTQDKKAQKLYDEGLKCYDTRNNECAEDKFQKAIKRDPNFLEAYTMLGYVYTDMKKDDLAIEQLKKAITINPRFFPNNFFTLARLEIGLGRYAEAKKNFEAYLSFPTPHEDMRNRAKLDIQNCEFAIEQVKNPKPFDPVNMGENINTGFHEYFPSITADGQLFLFTRDISDTASPHGHQEDFYVSIRNKDKWGPSYSIGNPINTRDNEGAPSITADGQLVIFTACETFGDYGPGRKGLGSCDIFYSQRYGDKWTKPENLGPKINSGYWESQPSFSSDGKTLYFVRGIQTREGKSQDIYMAELGDDGNWKAATKLPDHINTTGREESVFIHPDNQTLYFSSNGHIGMGGLDIYMCKRQPNGEWGQPLNLGYPINTFEEENSLLVGPDGNIAYFASTRAGGFGGLDLYQFEMPKDVRPEKLTYMKGKVYDARTKKPLEAMFELIDLATAKTVITSTSNPGNGEFLVTLPANKDYALNVSKKGYLFYSENFSLKDGADLSKPFLMDVPLQPIDTGMPVILKNVFFETDKFDLKDESKGELNKLVGFLKNNPTLKIELSGHTDNVGDDKKNQVLSENRAKSVYNYLVSNGIPKERLTHKGYGETRPIEKDQSTPENRAKNRRTEFKIIAK